MIVLLISAVIALGHWVQSILTAALTVFSRAPARVIAPGIPIDAYTYHSHPVLSIPFISGYLHTLAVLVKDAALVFSEMFVCDTHVQVMDGARLSLHWTQDLNQRSDARVLCMPVVVVFPGLTGDHKSPYVRTLTYTLMKNGFVVVVAPPRGVGQSTMGSSQGYNARFTGDFKAVLHEVKRLRPSASNIFAVGFSLGANILVNCLADHSLPDVHACVAIGSPWHTPSTNKRVNRFFPRLIFGRALNHGLQRFLQRNLQTLKQSKRAHQCDFKKARLSTSVLEFDRVVTAPLSGYKSVDEYYEDSSSAYRLYKVDVPLLSIDALDDPICDARSCPTNASQLPKDFTAVQVAKGGHLGFIEWTGFNLDFLRTSYCDRLAAAFLKSKQSRAAVGPSKDSISQ